MKLFLILIKHLKCFYLKYEREILHNAVKKTGQGKQQQRKQIKYKKRKTFVFTNNNIEQSV